jgi:nucleotide-binding universal stress UspA family protein
MLFAAAACSRSGDAVELAQSGMSVTKRRIATREGAHMFCRILVPVDGSAASRQGLNQAIKLATLSGATIKLVHVVNELVDSSCAPAQYYETVVMDLRVTGERMLDDASNYARAQGVSVVSELIETTAYRAAGIIVEAAMRWHADLIAMGTHGRRGVSRALGSDAEIVLRLAPVPVLIVPDAV